MAISVVKCMHVVKYSYNKYSLFIIWEFFVKLQSPIAYLCIYYMQPKGSACSYNQVRNSRLVPVPIKVIQTQQKYQEYTNARTHQVFDKNIILVTAIITLITWSIIVIT